MNRFLSSYKAQHLAHTYGETAYHQLQISKRLKDLLPHALLQATKSHRDDQTEKKKRLALLDPIYLDHLEQLLESHKVYRHARVEFECHHMLIAARKSMKI